MLDIKEATLLSIEIADELWEMGVERAKGTDWEF